MSDPLLSIGMPAFSGVVDKLESFDALEALRVWGAEWGLKVTAAIQAVTPVAEDGGGALRDSITFAGVESASGGVSLSWTTDKDYATYLIEGTQAHGPATAQFLHWFSGGGSVFAKWVRGIDANTFPLSDAVEGVLPAMQASLAELFEEL